MDKGHVFLRLTSAVGWPRRPLSLGFRVLIVVYLGSVILLSYQDGLTWVTKLIGVALIVCFVISALMRRRPLRWPTSYLIWAIWIAFAMFTGIQATQIELAASKVLTVAQVFLMALVFTNLLLWHGSTRFYWMAITGCALLSCGLVWSDLEAFSGSDGRVHGPLGNANAFGAMLVVGFIIGLATLLERTQVYWKAMWVTTAGILFAMILQTGSRQALLAALAGVIVILIGLIRRLRVGGWHGLAVLLIVGTSIPVGLHFATSGSYWFRVEAAIAGLSGGLSVLDTSLDARVSLFKAAIDIALEHPIAGIGLDNFRGQPGSMGSQTSGTYSHSNYTEILVSTGLVGFALYYSVFVLWVRKLYRGRHLVFQSNDFPGYVRVTAIVVALIVMDFSSVNYYDKFMWLILAWVVAELASIGRSRAASTKAIGSS